MDPIKIIVYHVFKIFTDSKKPVCLLVNLTITIISLTVRVTNAHLVVLYVMNLDVLSAITQCLL